MQQTKKIFLRMYSLLARAVWLSMMQQTTRLCPSRCHHANSLSHPLFTSVRLCICICHRVFSMFTKYHTSCITIKYTNSYFSYNSKYYHYQQRTRRQNAVSCSCDPWVQCPEMVNTAHSIMCRSRLLGATHPASG